MKSMITPTGITGTGDDGEEFAGQEALDAFNRRIEEQQEARQRFTRERPLEWACYCHARGYADAPSLPPSQVRRLAATQGRAPRAAQNDRRRGSRRGQRAKSSSSDDPGGDDSDEDDRRCIHCGGPIPEDRRTGTGFCSDRHRTYFHRRRKTERELVRDESQLDQESLTLDPCSCPGCAAARNGHYEVDLRILSTWIEQIEENRSYERALIPWPPRLSNGVAPVARSWVIQLPPTCPPTTAARARKGGENS